MSSIIPVIQAMSISVSLLSAGGIAALSLFDIPELEAQPASRSLPAIRWLFSRGSHIFPTAALISSAAFAYLAYNALPSGSGFTTEVFTSSSSGSAFRGYLSAAMLAISIAPFTIFIMIPTNFAIIKMNEEKGGARSEKSAEQLKRSGVEQRSAGDSVNSKGEASQLTDLSRPQAQTSEQSTQEEDEKARKLLAQFAALNSVRAILIGAGGLAGLWTALKT